MANRESEGSRVCLAPLVLLVMQGPRVTLVSRVQLESRGPPEQQVRGDHLVLKASKASLDLLAFLELWE